MIVFSPDYPQNFLPKGAPRIAMIDDRSRRGWRLICQLLTEAGGEVVVIPRTVSDHFVCKCGLKDEQGHLLRASDCLDITPEQKILIDEIRREHLAEVEKIMASVQAVILPGNEYDIPPLAYGESAIHPATRLTKPLDFRFETESLMAKHALANELPVLGICGGLQLLVTLTGGRLIQHLPDALKAKKNVHDNCIKNVSEKMLQWMECDYVEFLDDPYKPCPVEANHPVMITDEASQLARIAEQHFGGLFVCDNPALGVFSIHHQGAFEEQVKTSQLKVTAKAPDGIVEAVEHVSHPFCIAVQFHPEFDIKGLALPLMKELLSRCGK